MCKSNGDLSWIIVASDTLPNDRRTIAFSPWYEETGVERLIVGMLTLRAWEAEQFTREAHGALIDCSESWAFWSRGPTVLLIEDTCATQKLTLTTIAHHTNPEIASGTASLSAK